MVCLGAMSQQFLWLRYGAFCRLVESFGATRVGQPWCKRTRCSAGTPRAGGGLATERCDGTRGQGGGSSSQLLNIHGTCSEPPDAYASFPSAEHLPHVLWTARQYFKAMISLVKCRFAGEPKDSAMDQISAMLEVRYICSPFFSD